MPEVEEAQREQAGREEDGTPEDKVRVTQVAKCETCGRERDPEDLDVVLDRAICSRCRKQVREFMNILAQKGPEKPKEDGE